MKTIRNVGLLLFVTACVLLVALTIQLAFEEARVTSSSAGDIFLANAENTATPVVTEMPVTRSSETPTPGPSPTFDSSATGDF